MATVTVSASGGTRNWSDTATWVGGALPLASDDIVANVTSGPLTVDSNRTCLTINFINYTNTFTINNGVTLNITGTTITLGSGMTYTQGTTGILSTSAGNQGAVAIAFNGVTIPRLTVGKLSTPNLQTISVSGASPTVQHLTTSSAQPTQVTLAGLNLTVTTSLSILGTTSLTGLPPTITGTCTFNTVGNISGGFSVSSGSTVVLANTLRVGGGTVTFAAGSFLTDVSFGISVNFSTSVLNTAPVTWYSFTQTATGTTFITSNLNIGNGGINVGALATFAFNGAFNVNVSGSVIAPTINLSSNATLNLTGTGNITITGIATGTVNITTGATYAITGTTLSLNVCIFNLVGTATCSVPATHTLTLTSSTLTTNNTITGANIVGGSEIIWRNINLVFTSGITYATTITGNLAGTNATSAILGAKILVGGNLSIITNGTFSGTSTIEFTDSGAATWGVGTYQNNIIVNKSGGAIVTTGASITYGAANRTLTMNSPVNFLANSTTFTLSGTPLTINNFIGSPFFNMTIPNNTTLILNGLTSVINNNLTLSGNAVFQGTVGWTCNNLIAQAAAATITLQQAVTYRTRVNVNITGGTNAVRAVMKSSDLVNRAIWTLDPGAAQSLIYVNGTRIDSSGGQTVWSFGVAPADIATSINWNLGSRPGTVAHVFVF